MSDNIFSEVIESVVSMAHVPAGQVTAETSLEDILVDSLQRITFVIDLEERFEVDLRSGPLENIKTVGDVVEKIRKARLETERR